MKPSEYLFNEDFMILNDDYKLKVINKLDKRFIDREELKDKINKQIKEVKDIRDYPYSYKFLDTNQKKNLELECNYKIEAKEEILELIKWKQLK